MERNTRNDLPLIIGAVVGLVLSGVIIFVSVDVATPSEAIDSNSPNATTPGPESSFNIR
ncbi:MAG: hypothetical protein ABIO67_03770 [Mycobacteriales bacterium]